MIKYTPLLSWFCLSFLCTYSWSILCQEHPRLHPSANRSLRQWKCGPELLSPLFFNVGVESSNASEFWGHLLTALCPFPCRMDMNDWHMWVDPRIQINECLSNSVSVYTNIASTQESCEMNLVLSSVPAFALISTLYLRQCESIQVLWICRLSLSLCQSIFSSHVRFIQSSLHISLCLFSRWSEQSRTKSCWTKSCFRPILRTHSGSQRWQLHGKPWKAS